MRKYYTEHRYKIWQRIKKLKQAKRNVVTKRKIIERNTLRNSQSKGQKEVYREKIGKTVVVAPVKFCILTNCDKSIKFINKLEILRKSHKPVFVVLDQVQELDYAAVTVLLSIMFSFKQNNIPFNGDFPKSLELRRMLIDSDFIKYIKRPSIPKRTEYVIGKRNQIFTRGFRDVNSELGKVVMEEVSKTIWGQKRACKGLQRVLLELMQNTNNHASKKGKGEKFWWLSVNHDRENKKVSFVFVDYGIGIFESLNNKPPDNRWFGWLPRLFNLRGEIHDNQEVFQLLLSGDLHKSVTGKHFRGKGLPGVHECFKRNQISDLHFISNDVFADIKNDKFRILNNHFSGTFVYWELNEENVNIPWNID